MKKNLLYLFMLLSTVTFMTACSDDEDVDVAGAYRGDITINIGAEQTEEPTILRDQAFTITKNNSKSMNLSITGLVLEAGVEPMDINVPNVPFTVSGDKATIDAKGLTIPLTVLGGLEAEINEVTGSVVKKNVDLKIVAYQEFVRNVYITVSGVKQ